MYTTIEQVRTPGVLAYKSLHIIGYALLYSRMGETYPVALALLLGVLGMIVGLALDVRARASFEWCEKVERDARKVGSAHHPHHLPAAAAAAASVNPGHKAGAPHAAGGSGVGVGSAMGPAAVPTKPSNGRSSLWQLHVPLGRPG